MTNEQRLIAEAREVFLKERTQQEITVSNWGKRIESSPELLSRIDFELPNPMLLEKLIPELYADNPDPIVYQEQFNKANEMITKVNRIVEDINEEARQCLLEYKQLTSRQA